MLRTALWPTLAIGLICVGVAWFLQGAVGLAGALIGLVIVLLFFTTSLIVMSRTAKIAPINVMAVGVLVYVTKVGLLALFFMLLRDASWMSGQAFAVTVLICAAIWMPLEILGYTRARILVYDEPEQPASTSSAAASASDSRLERADG